MRFDYLSPAIGPVVEGLEVYERIVALEQMNEYIPLRVLPAEDGQSAIYRIELTDEQRDIIAQGGALLVEILTFGGPLAPSRVMVCDPVPEDQKIAFARWFAVQSKGPYRVRLNGTTQEPPNGD